MDSWQSGDDEAAEKLYQRYAQRLSAYVGRALGRELQRRVSADDILQSTFRTFFRRSRNGDFPIRPEGTVWRLIATIALNKIRRQADRHTKAQKRDVAREVPLAGPAAESLVSSRPTHVETAIFNDELARLCEKLHPRDVLILSLLLTGHKIEEIAAAAECSRQTVWRVLGRIKEHCAQRLASEE